MQHCHHGPVNPRRRIVAVALSTLTALLAVSGLIGLAAPAHANGNCVTYFAGQGTGTAGDPYLVGSQLDLAEVSFCRSSSFRQTQDITLTGLWTPLGTNPSPFTGTYDGADFSISGLDVNLPTTDEVGLFGYTSGAILSSIRLPNGSVAGQDYVGGLAGVALNTTITSCFSAASIAGGNTVGGLVGDATAGTSITQSYAQATIRATGNYVGGLAGGLSSSSSVSNSFATGAVSGNGQVGGLIGESDHSTVTNSYATGLVTAGAPGNSQGGLVGQQDTGSYPGSTWDVDTTGQTDASMSGLPHTNPPTASTTTQMKAIGTFTSLGWSISSTYRSASTWLLCPSVNGGYPLLTHFIDSSNPPCAGSMDMTLWHLSIARGSMADECPQGYHPSWAQWPNGSTGGWVCNREVYAYRPLPVS